MAQVNISVAGKIYRMSCGDGEEEHIAALADVLDKKISALREAFGDIGEMRLQVMAALYFADEMADLKKRLAQVEGQIGSVQSDATADVQAMRAEMVRVAKAIDGMAARIENAAKAIG
ncbi:MAG: cell division protein ZapA [Beijerinckiaceae bacterium]